ncbi:hypothetical protein D3C73_1031680 [compost metagenome]
MADIFLAEGKYHLQVPIFGLFLTGREMEIVRFKTVQLGFRCQQQGQRVKQAGFTPGIFAEQQRVVVQHQ